jgi:hypothetical protein
MSPEQLGDVAHREAGGEQRADGGGELGRGSGLKFARR